MSCRKWEAMCNGTADCGCDYCGAELSPVCSRSGLTYDNLCQLGCVWVCLNTFLRLVGCFEDAMSESLRENKWIFFQTMEKEPDNKVGYILFNMYTCDDQCHWVPLYSETEKSYEIWRLFLRRFSTRVFVRGYFFKNKLRQTHWMYKVLRQSEKKPVYMTKHTTT